MSCLTKVADVCKMFYLTHICNFSFNITFTSFTTLNQSINQNSAERYSESGETYVKGSSSPEIPLFIDVSEW